MSERKFVKLRGLHTKEELSKLGKWGDLSTVYEFLDEKGNPALKNGKPITKRWVKEGDKYQLKRFKG